MQTFKKPNRSSFLSRQHTWRRWYHRSTKPSNIVNPPWEELECHQDLLIWSVDENRQKTRTPPVDEDVADPPPSLAQVNIRGISGPENCVSKRLFCHGLFLDIFGHPNVLGFVKPFQSNSHHNWKKTAVGRSSFRMASLGILAPPDGGCRIPRFRRTWPTTTSGSPCVMITSSV